MQKNSSRIALAILAITLTLAAASVSAQQSISTQFMLPSGAADATKPGFIWRFSEVNAAEPNLLSWADDQMRGLKGPNLADPNAVGNALSPATPANPNTAPIVFEIPTVI